MITLCQGDFKEQIQKLMLLYTTENCLRKGQACVHFVPN